MAVLVGPGLVCIATKPMKSDDAVYMSAMLSRQLEKYYETHSTLQSWASPGGSCSRNRPWRSLGRLEDASMFNRSVALLCFYDFLFPAPDETAG
jgi:hypothetical protein